MKLLTSLILWAGALFAGILQGVFFFADYSRGESPLTRVLLSLALAVFSGTILGYRFPKQWGASLLAVWLPVVFLFFAILSTITRQTALGWEGLVLVVPIIATLGASYFGASVKKVNARMLFWVVLCAAILVFVGTTLYTSQR